MEFNWTSFEKYKLLSTYGKPQKCGIVCDTPEQVTSLAEELNKRNIIMSNGKPFDLYRIESVGAMIKRVLRLESCYPIIVFNEGTIGVFRKDDNSYSDSILFNYDDIFNPYEVVLV